MGMGTAISAGGKAAGGGGKGGGGGGSIDFDAREYAGQANQILEEALADALPYSEGFTDKAIGSIQDMQQQAQVQSELGYQRSKAQQTPFSEAGYRGLDSYLDTLGVARPEMGSARLAQALEKSAGVSSLRGQAQGVLDDILQNKSPIEGMDLTYENMSPSSMQLMSRLAQMQNVEGDGGMPDFMGTGMPGDRAGGVDEDYLKWVGSKPLESYTDQYSQYRQTPESLLQRHLGLAENFISGYSGELRSPEDMAEMSNILNRGQRINSQLQQAIMQYSPQEQRTADAYNYGLFGDVKQKEIY